MIVAFTFSNIYIWNFLNTQVNVGGYANGNFIAPRIQINGLQVTVGTDGWTSTGIAIPTPLPISVPNYPFYVFWVATVGNLVLMAFALNYWRTETSMKGHGDKLPEIR